MNYIDWISSRGLRVLDYQINTIAKVQQSFEQREITVLAAAPSAGKTIMAIYIADDYLRQNPTHKVLVLAHGTMILRTQFHDVLEEIKPDFTYNLVEKFNQYDINAHANICLPQTLSGNVLSKIDLLIVDEAHQFYFAKKMMKDILKQIKPKKQLLLTGTPSPFIRKGYNIIPVTLNTIFDEGMVSDLYVEIATSSYSFDPIYDFNREDELKTSVHFKNSETKKTLDDLIAKIVERLKSIKGNTYQNLLPEWLPTLKRLQKTMIACRSQHQAMQVKDYFDRIGVKSALSISDIDYDSKEIQVFKDEQDCLILIVVGRGILGFNYPELVNIVDMTTSQNVDRIYQLLCRVIRPHPEGHKKLFFKVAPNIHSDYYKYIMTAVLSLADENFFTKFNGKNFSDMIIPVIKAHTKKSNTEPRDNTKKKSSKGKIKPVDFEGLPVFEFFKDLYHKKDALLHVYAYTTVRDVRAEFSKFTPSGYWTFEKCLESALKFNKPEDWYKTDGGALQAARRNGWYNECVKHMTIGKNAGYWTKERCVEDALNYQTKKEWMQHNNTPYSVALKNDWLKECTAHMKILHKPKDYWTKEKCLESALKYESITKWSKGEPTAYRTARQNNWFDECTKHMQRLQQTLTKWTKEKCLESALKYQRPSDWKKYENTAYRNARENGWLEECRKHMQKKNLIWTKEKCLESALKYKTPTEWAKNEDGAYNRARKSGWMEECTTHMKKRITKNNRKSNGYWTKEKCLESALKYKRLSDWSDNEPSAYFKAKKLKCFEECVKHMSKVKHWTKDEIFNNALKYSTKIEWLKNEPTLYREAHRKGYLTECCAHMILIQNPHGYWKIKENCIESAKKYKTTTEWIKNEAGAYDSAQRNNWLNECRKHMQSNSKPKKYWTKEKCIESAKNFIKPIDWKIGESTAYSVAHKNGWFDECTVHMQKRNNNIK